jgi:hypothetical protein
MLVTIPARVTVHGYVDPGFEQVRQAFDDNFARRHEVGGALCLVQGQEDRRSMGRHS